MEKLQNHFLSRLSCSCCTSGCLVPGFHVSFSYSLRDWLPKNRSPVPSLVPAATPLLTSSQLWPLYLDRLWFQLEPVPHCTVASESKEQPPVLAQLSASEAARQRDKGWQVSALFCTWVCGELVLSGQAGTGRRGRAGNERKAFVSLGAESYVWCGPLDDINSQNLLLYAVKLRQFVLFEFIYVSRVLNYPIQRCPYRLTISTFFVGSRFLNNEFAVSWIILKWERGSIV